MEAGPLCTQLVWRGRCGLSSWRLDVRLRAASPVLELILSVAWRQRHELLRLECPLAQPSVRWVSDVAAGVLERPSSPRSARERSRWEVTATSWLASQNASASGGGGLALLLDGPQGVSGQTDRLGVSLLRGPTWPDPGADAGVHRLRLGLMPLSTGWHHDGVVEAAQEFRNPIWCAPARPGMNGQTLTMPALPALPDGVVLVALRPWPDHAGHCLLSLQNLTPERRRIRLGAGWSVVGRVDGLGAAMPEDGSTAQTDDLMLTPWQLGHWRIAASLQSS
nr:glycoside hydrolase family 38 C-terminal domain-containing protein [Synechococcus sp. RSCCF101]